MQGPGGMPAQHVLPVSIAPATIFMVDALDTETRALVAQGLFSVGSAAALAAAPASGPPVMGLCCLKRARGPTGQEDVKLQVTATFKQTVRFESLITVSCLEWG